MRTIGESVSAGAAPASQPLVAIGAMIVLAALDLAGAMLARHWSDHRSLLGLVGGIVVFSLLFLAYGSSLAYADLATVTFGWIVMLQVGVVVLQRVEERAPIGIDRAAAMAVMLALQAYLLLAPRRA
jgi:hypothetical protein